MNPGLVEDDFIIFPGDASFVYVDSAKENAKNNRFTSLSKQPLPPKFCNPTFPPAPSIHYSVSTIPAALSITLDAPLEFLGMARRRCTRVPAAAVSSRPPYLTEDAFSNPHFPPLPCRVYSLKFSSTKKVHFFWMQVYLRFSGVRFQSKRGLLTKDAFS